MLPFHCLLNLLDQGTIAWWQRGSEAATNVLTQPFFRHTQSDILSRADPPGVDWIGFLRYVFIVVWRTSPGSSSSSSQRFRLWRGSSGLGNLRFELASDQRVETAPKQSGIPVDSAPRFSPPALFALSIPSAF